MEQLTDHHYEVLRVPEESAANCVYVRGPSTRDFLLHRPAEECPDSVAVSDVTPQRVAGVWSHRRPAGGDIPTQQACL